jgi:serine/threonine-protein kinase
VDPAGVQRKVRLPKLGELGENDCYIPGGWFWAGGDENAANALSRHRVWIDAFVMKKIPVTNREYLLFLDDLVRQGREEEALRYVPRERAGQVGRLGDMIYCRQNDGTFVLVSDVDGDRWELDWPVIMVDWHCAVAYEKWFSKRTGLGWRLPHELEWEKSGRGVDGRFYVWGDGFDSSYACMRNSHQGRKLPSVVDSFNIDESVYGVWGLAGNVCDWTGSVYSPDWSGVAVEKGVLVNVSDVDSGEPANSSHRVHRGGSWNSPTRYMCVSSRGNYTPSYRSFHLGLRLSRSASAK